MSLSVVPGAVVVHKGRILQVDGMDTLTHVSARDTATNRLVSVPLGELEAIPKPAQKREAGFIPESEWRRCTAVGELIAALAPEGRASSEALIKISREAGVGVRQVQRLRAKYLRMPKVSSLTRGAAGRPAGHRMLAPEVEKTIRHVINKSYRRRERPSKAETVEQVRSLCRRLKLSPPSPNAILRRIDDQSGFACDKARLGTKAAKQLWEARPGQLRIERPLELIQIDHTPVDVIVLDTDRKTVLGRPWITVAIDVGSRCVIGIYLSMDAPSATSVSLCIEHAVLPKPENVEEPGIWPMYGLPKRILVDNGKDFRSMALMRGCEEHGIELTWRPVRTPHYGAHIERLIGTLMNMVHLVPGTTFSNVKQRGDYQSEKRAQFTMDELYQWLVQRICRRYHTRVHRGIGLPPLLSWERGLTTAAGDYVPPKLVANPAEFRMDFLPYEFRRVLRGGISLFNSRYSHPELESWEIRGEDVMVRYHPRKLAVIWVRNPKTESYLEVPSVAGPACGQDLPKGAVDAEARQRLDAETDRGYAATEAIEAAAAKATRRARRGAAKATDAEPAKATAPATAPTSDPPASDTSAKTLNSNAPASDFLNLSPASKPSALTVEEW